MQYNSVRETFSRLGTYSWFDDIFTPSDVHMTPHSTNWRHVLMTLSVIEGIAHKVIREKVSRREIFLRTVWKKSTEYGNKYTRCLPLWLDRQIYYFLNPRYFSAKLNIYLGQRLKEKCWVELFHCTANVMTSPLLSTSMSVTSNKFPITSLCCLPACNST